jgi:hypothetical protein
VLDPPPCVRVGAAVIAAAVVAASVVEGAGSTPLATVLTGTVTTCPTELVGFELEPPPGASVDDCEEVEEEAGGAAAVVAVDPPPGATAFTPHLPIGLSPGNASITPKTCSLMALGMLQEVEASFKPPIRPGHLSIPESPALQLSIICWRVATSHPARKSP